MNKFLLFVLLLVPIPEIHAQMLISIYKINNEKEVHEISLNGGLYFKDRTCVIRDDSHEYMKILPLADIRKISIDKRLNQQLDNNILSEVKFIGRDRISLNDKSNIYSIYNLNGVLFNTGEIRDGFIDISSLQRGFYVIKTEKIITKFFKE